MQFCGKRLALSPKGLATIRQVRKKNISMPTVCSKKTRMDVLLKTILVYSRFMEISYVFLVVRCKKMEIPKNQSQQIK